IEKGLDAGPPSSDHNLHELPEAEVEAMGIRLLPANLLAATEELERNDVMRKALGACANEDYIDYYVRIKRGEWERAHSEITDWEIERYLQLF
ncbi:MAG TPA: hypothetical protein VG458_00830, partial [Solirubrobacterales bacterium]|nr:hypothetical protein [Solirubrobacterales bacterium]